MTAAALRTSLAGSRLDRAEMATVVASLQSLPAMPIAVTRLAALLAEGDASPDDVERVVQLDAALTAKLLALANSPHWGARAEIRSVRHAAALLGGQRIFEALVVASMSNLLPSRLPGYDMDSGSLWMHFVSTAVIAEELARAVAPAELPSVFAAGLLHDVGKLAVAAVLRARWHEIDARLCDGSRTLVEAEREVLGTTHAELGELLLRSWGLPPVFAEVARHHHDPLQAPASARQVVGLVHLANVIAHGFGLGSDAAGLARRPVESVRAELGVGSALVERAVLDSLERIHRLTRAAGLTEDQTGLVSVA